MGFGPGGATLVIAIELEGGQNSLVTIVPWGTLPAAAGLFSVERVCL
jgi:hypothetical protein